MSGGARLRGPALDEHERQQGERPEGEAHGGVGERAHVLHAGALGHEGEAPDGGGEEEERVVREDAGPAGHARHRSRRGDRGKGRAGRAQRARGVAGGRQRDPAAPLVLY